MKPHTTLCWLALIPAMVMAVAMAGCKFSSEYGNTRYRCDVSGQCPDGFACVNGYCEASQGDAGVDTDSGILDKACGTVEMAVEDFEAAEIDRDRWDSWVDEAELSVEHRGGQLAFEFPAGSSQGSGHYLRDLYKFRGGRAYVEVVDAQADSDVGLYFWISVKDWQDRWFIRQRGGTLSFMYRINDENFNLGSISYDPITHRWWQLREQDGTVYWETSPDAVSWTTHAMMASNLTTQNVFVMFSTWLDVPEETARTLMVDNLNGGVDTGIGWCAASTLTDDFDDGIMNSEWDSWENSNCILHEQDGQLSFELVDVTSYNDCGYYTSLLFDLSDSAFVVEAPAADIGDMHVALTAWFGDDDLVEIWHGHGDLIGFKKVQGAGEETFAIPFDPAQHRWWRLRGDGGTAYWETSADGKTWTTHASRSDPLLQLDAVELSLWGWADENVVAVDNIGNGFDNLNLPPAP